MLAPPKDSGYVGRDLKVPKLSPAVKHLARNCLVAELVGQKTMEKSFLIKASWLLEGFEEDC